MEHHSEAFVALDTAKLRNAVAIADAGRSGEIRYLGEIANTEAETRKLVAKLASKHARLTFCYEAGPTGYGLYRLIKSSAMTALWCTVADPIQPDDRVKTIARRRQSREAAQAAELTAVWVPDERHEAMRTSCGLAMPRSRTTESSARNVSSLLLRLGRSYRARKLGRTHINWLTGLKLEHREQRIAFEEMLLVCDSPGTDRAVGTGHARAVRTGLWTSHRGSAGMRGIDMVGAIASWPSLAIWSRFENPVS